MRHMQRYRHPLSSPRLVARVNSKVVWEAKIVSFLAPSYHSAFDLCRQANAVGTLRLLCNGLGGRIEQVGSAASSGV